MTEIVCDKTLVTKDRYDKSCVMLNYYQI